MIATDIITAANGVLKKQWPIVQKYVESEAQVYAQRLASVAQMLADGIITEERAKKHLAMQQEACETVLLSVEGLTQLMIEAAFNAAIKEIRDAVNKAAKFALL